MLHVVCPERRVAQIVVQVLCLPWRLLDETATMTLLRYPKRLHLDLLPNHL